MGRLAWTVGVFRAVDLLIPKEDLCLYFFKISFDDPGVGLSVFDPGFLTLALGFPVGLVTLYRGWPVDE